MKTPRGYPPFRLTELNIATTLLYTACRKSGGHRASGEVVLRDRGGPRATPMLICAHCRVPYARIVETYNGRYETGEVSIEDDVA